MAIDTGLRQYGNSWNVLSKYHPLPPFGVSMPSLTSHPAWSTLTALTQAPPVLSNLFAADPNRFSRHHLTLPGLLYDYSKNQFNADIIKTLLTLADTVPAARNRLFAGDIVNPTENRPALHTALRRPRGHTQTIDGHNVIADHYAALDRLAPIVNQLRSGLYKGVNEAPINAVLHLGIGGQDLGVRMAVAALGNTSSLTIHFVDNIDGHALAPVLRALDPTRTLVIVSSKTMTTTETLMNAAVARDWLLAGGVTAATLNRHFLAVTANVAAATAFGFAPASIHTFHPAIGGRYSLWSLAGFALMIAIGMERFADLARGAHTMDTHFATAPLAANMPIIMALMGILNINLYHRPALAVIPYDQRLSYLSDWLQQVDMESNGKRAANDGRTVQNATAPVIFGVPGTSAQHSFFQCLHQGPGVIPVDFIGIKTPDHHLVDHHQVLLANMIAQSRALMTGTDGQGGPAHCPGNRPSQTIILDRLDPYHLGLLLALYEHKIFTQGVIWGINSFDQYGVALGKTLAEQVIQDNAATADPSTQGLWRYLSQ